MALTSALLIFGVLGFRAQPPEAVAVPIDTESACELVCFDAPAYCSTGQHDAWEPVGLEPNSERAGGAHSGQICWEGTCETHHPPCTFIPDSGKFEAEEFEALRVAVATNDARTVRAIVEAFPNSVVLNRERGAIQIHRCGGEVIAHLPITSKLLASVGPISAAYAVDEPAETGAPPTR
jgi:hypothetical protein